MQKAIDAGGISHYNVLMRRLKYTKSTNDDKLAAGEILAEYDAATDAKKRISLRGAKTKYFHVKALSNGSYFLEPRVLVPPRAVSMRTLRMLDKSVANLKKGVASAPINLDAPIED